MGKTYTYAIFDSKQRAHDAIDALDDQFQARKIDVLLQDPDDERGTREIPLRMRTSVGTGIAVGAAFGAVAMVTVAIATTLFTSNALVAALYGVLLGSFGGGLVGALAGLGSWSTEADLPDDLGEDSTILVGVATAPDRVDVARDQLAEAGASQISVLEARRPSRAA